MGMIEKIARIYADWAGYDAPDAWRAYQGVARLILAEMRKPTAAMLDALEQEQNIEYGDEAELGWRAAIDAALAEPDQTKPEESPMSDEPTKIDLKEALIDPIWRGNGVKIGDGRMILLAIEHPRHGAINWLMPLQNAAGLRDWLIKALAELDST